MDLGFWIFSGGRLGLERIVLRPLGLKCTPLEPAPHNHVGPTDASKGHNCHGEPANIVENEPPGDHFFHAHARSYINVRKDLPPLEPVPQNHFGPTDTSKGHGSHGKHDGSCGEHVYNKTGYLSIALCF